jgi:hypothetical protein
VSEHRSEAEERSAMSMSEHRSEAEERSAMSIVRRFAPKVATA